MELWLVILFRLLFPLVIFKSPFLGGILALALDFFDQDIIRLFNPQIPEIYQSLDKILDLYYLSFEFLIVFRWKDTFARDLGKSLFLYRLVGILLFEITQIRKLLFFFPNLFEMFFLFYTGHKFFLKREPNLFKLWVILFLSGLFLYKIYQELSLHVLNLHPWWGSQFLGIK